VRVGAVLRPIVLAPLIALGSAVGASAQAGVPLCPGLRMVGTVSEPQGDYEPIITVDGVDGDAVHLRFTSQHPAPGGSLRKLSVRRTVRRADLDTATALMAWFNPRAPVLIPGTTAISTSRAILRALKTTGATLGLFEAGTSALPATSVHDYRMNYALHRVPDAPPRLALLVNGAVRELPVVHARGMYMGEVADLVVLDDEANPLVLRLSLGSSEEVPTLARATRISYPCSPGGGGAETRVSPLERALLESGRADVYDIYFDFDSDRIREESGPTLREIADLLRRHPDWRLAISGHTDGIGNDRYNLELSARRAAAVKAALTGLEGVGKDRLTTSGAGETSPKDRNDTPEGRARNRRVELVRVP
jgi:outer membrane protein OmpA-like peptidoglycan-associated protein